MGEVFRPAKRRSRRVRAKCSSAWRRLVRRKLTITIVPTKDNFDDLAGWLEQSGAPVKLATGGPPVCVERLRRYHGLISAFGYGAAWVIGCQNDEDKMWLQLKFGAPHPKARTVQRFGSYRSSSRPASLNRA
jgi:hypothetical protein